MHSIVLSNKYINLWPSDFRNWAITNRYRIGGVAIQNSKPAYDVKLLVHLLNGQHVVIARVPKNRKS